MTAALAVLAAVAAMLALAWAWRPRRPFAPAVLILLAAYAVLGGWALWFGLFAPPGAEPAALAHWKPTIMYWTLALILAAAPLLGLGEPVKPVLGAYFAFSSREWRWLNRGFAAFFAVLGALNLVFVFGYSEADWAGFKFGCMVNVLIILLMRLSFVWLDVVGRIAVLLYGRARAFFG